MKFNICSPILLILLLSTSGFSTSIDSLISAASKQSGSVKAATLVQLSFQYKDIDPERGVRLGLEAAQFATGISDFASEGGAYTAIAVNYINIGHYDSVVTYAMKARTIGEEHNIPSLIADSQNYIGLAFYFLGNSKQAIRFYEMALEFRIKDKNLDKLSKLYNNLSIAYSMEGDLLNSEKYTFLSLETKKKVGDFNSLVRTYSNLASIYRKKKDYKLSFAYLDTTYELSVKYNYEGGKGLVFKGYARNYADQGEYAKAIEYTNKASNIFVKLNDPRGKCEISLELAEYLQKNNQLKEAIAKLEEVVSTAKKYDFKIILTNCYVALFNLAKNNDDPVSALKYAEILIGQKDSLFTQSSYNNLLLKSIDYEIKLKDQEIKSLSEREQLQNLQNNRNFMIILIVLFSLASLLIAILVIYYQKRSSLKLVQDMINAVTDPFVLINASNNEILIRNNSEITNLFKGKDIGTILTPERIRRIKDEKKFFIEEAEYKAENGEVFHFNLNFYPSLGKGNEVEKIVLYAANITDLKNAENTIKKYLHKIKISEEELIKSNENKDQLISILGHDLRNPFILLINIADILIDEYYDMTEQEKFKLLKDSQRTAIATHQILENLLSWARTQSKSLSVVKEPLDLNKIVESIIMTVSPLAEAKEISIENDILPNLPSVFFDKFMLDTIVRNIVSNSIKYTPEKGKITITLDRSNDDRVVLKICDTGMGMTQGEIDRILSEDSIKSIPGTNNEKGTGIGLIISKKFLKLNGTSLKIESAPGEGTCMSFDIYKM